MHRALEICVQTAVVTHTWAKKSMRLTSSDRLIVRCFSTCDHKMHRNIGPASWLTVSLALDLVNAQQPT